MLIQTFILFRGHGFQFIFIALVAMFNTFKQVTKKERKIAMSLKLPYMGQLMAQPLFIIDNFRFRCIV